MKIVFATGNPNKVKEVNQSIGNAFKIISLADIGCTEEIPETQYTIRRNAIQKTLYVVDNYKVDCFSEDTGLQVEALHGQPGVHSARYAGAQKNADDNMNLLLQKLEGSDNRKARFKTVIALYTNGELRTFEGVCEGTISLEKKGTGGFGYDPIFIPDGYDRSFAELSSLEKNSISHRGKAVAQLTNFLKRFQHSDEEE